MFFDLDRRLHPPPKTHVFFVDNILWTSLYASLKDCVPMKEHGQGSIHANEVAVFMQMPQRLGSWLGFGATGPTSLRDAANKQRRHSGGARQARTAYCILRIARAYSD